MVIDIMFCSSLAENLRYPLIFYFSLHFVNLGKIYDYIFMILLLLKKILGKFSNCIRLLRWHNVKSIVQFPVFEPY